MRTRVAGMSMVVLLLAPSAAIACSCAMPDDVPVAFGESTVVVAATAADVRLESTTQVVQWDVGERWKGPYGRGERFETRTVVQRGLCGRPVAKGERLLLYLPGPPPYEVSLCSRTSRLQRREGDVPRLRELSGTSAEDGAAARP